jgi:integrase
MRETTKTGKGRDVPIVPTLAADLIALRDSIESPDDLGCQSKRGRPVYMDFWRRRVFDPAAKPAGVEWATQYSDRHSFISWHIRGGIDPVTVAGWPTPCWPHGRRSRTAVRPWFDLQAMARFSGRSKSAC